MAGWDESLVPPAKTAQFAPVPKAPPVIVNVTFPPEQTFVLLAARVGVVEGWLIAIAILLLVGGLLALSHVPPSAFTE